MRFLFLHNKYLISGGEDVSTISEINLLKEHGHHVDVLFANNEELNKANKISLALNTIWSSNYYNKVIQLIDENNYDIIHVQNFFPQISPSVFYAAKKKGIKIVMSVRNYRLVCPNALLYIDNKICELCVGKTLPTPSIARKCYKNDLLATTVTATMLSFHNVAHTWSKKVDGFIAISSFVKNQLVKGGITEDLIHVKHNFVSSPPVNYVVPQSHFLYVGRLSTEKGIEFLIKAFESDLLKKYSLKIIGDGPLTDMAVTASLKNENISYLGKLPIQETYQEISRAKALIFPSQWHEPFGRTIIEAFACGTPVIGASVGGVTELITEGQNGYLFDSSKEASLVEKITELEHNPDEQKMRLNARQTYETKFTGDINYDLIMSIYTLVLNK